MFRLVVGCFGVEEGGHGCAGCFCVFVWEMYLDCKFGQMATLTLIPNDVCESANVQDKLSFVDFEE